MSLNDLVVRPLLDCRHLSSIACLIWRSMLDALTQVLLQIYGTDPPDRLGPRHIPHEAYVPGQRVKLGRQVLFLHPPLRVRARIALRVHLEPQTTVPNKNTTVVVVALSKHIGKLPTHQRSHSACLEVIA